MVSVLEKFKPSTRTDDLPQNWRPSVDQYVLLCFILGRDTDHLGLCRTTLQHVTLLLEGITASKIAGSVPLIRALLDALAAVCFHHVTARSDIDYLEQLLISALESAVDALDVSHLSCSSRALILLFHFTIGHRNDDFVPAHRYSGQTYQL